MPAASPPQEKTPGVYIRTDEHELPHELDMLWSPSRPLHREGRSTLLAFLVGFITGGVLSALAFLLLTHPLPQLVPTPSPDNAASGKSAITGAGPEAVKPPDVRVYTVVNGDNLGRVSEKVYGSSQPRWIEKIRQANHLASPHALQLHQKLIIPPRDSLNARPGPGL